MGFLVAALVAVILAVGVHGTRTAGDYAAEHEAEIGAQCKAAVRYEFEDSKVTWDGLPADVRERLTLAKRSPDDLCAKQKKE